MASADDTADRIPPAQPPAGRDSTVTSDPDADPAQREWVESGLATDADGFDPEVGPTATGDDPAHIPDPLDEVPAEDLVTDAGQPESQGADPVTADLGEDGEGDLGPNDV